MQRVAHLLAVSLLAIPVLACPHAMHAATHPGDGPDPALLAQQEARAAQADPRERAYLYTELAHDYSELASRQFASGELEAAGASLRNVSHFIELIHAGLARDSKRVKNAEMLLQETAHHLAGSMRSVSTEDKPLVQSTLRDLNRINEELLAQVFAH